MSFKVDDKMIGQMMRLAHRGFSLRKIGKILGVDPQTVNYWINPFRNQLLKKTKKKYYKRNKRKSFLKRFFYFK